MAPGTSSQRLHRGGHRPVSQRDPRPGTGSHRHDNHRSIVRGSHPLAWGLGTARYAEDAASARSLSVGPKKCRIDGLGPLPLSVEGGSKLRKRIALPPSTHFDDELALAHQASVREVGGIPPMRHPRARTSRGTLSRGSHHPRPWPGEAISQQGEPGVGRCAASSPSRRYP